MDSFIDFLKLTAQGTVCILVFLLIMRAVGEIANYLLPDPWDMIVMMVALFAGFYAAVVKMTEPDDI